MVLDAPPNCAYHRTHTAGGPPSLRAAFGLLPERVEDRPGRCIGIPGVGNQLVDRLGKLFGKLDRKV